MVHVSAWFHEEEAAREAMDDLMSAGFPRERISFDMDEETRRRAERYPGPVRDGRFVVGVLAEDPVRADVAARTLEAAGARTPPVSRPADEPQAV